MTKSSNVIATQELHWGMDKSLPTGNTLIRVYDSDSLTAKVIYEDTVSNEFVEYEIAVLKKKFSIV